MSVISVDPKAKALIFDIDGTLVDTMKVHYEASRLVCNKYGFDFPIDYFYAKAGIPTIQVFKMLVKDLGLNLDGEMIGREKEEKYLELLHLVKPLKEVHDIAVANYGKMPMALGTGGTKDIAYKTIRAAGVEHMFEVIVTCEDVQDPKPAPDTFLLCAERMGIKPEYCQVFEDATMGVQAGKAAGMIVTDIRDYIGAPY